MLLVLLVQSSIAFTMLIVVALVMNIVSVDNIVSGGVIHESSFLFRK